MNVASRDLCKELYELSGWDNTFFVYVTEDEVAYFVITAEEARIEKWRIVAPAYDAGFLLRKLPSGAGVIKNSKDYTARRPNMLGSPENKDPFNGRTGWDGDTPENALCIMAIELFKAGILTKGEK